MNGGIDFGAEFDAFLVEYNVLIGNNMNMSNASRDQLREAFALVDSSKDGVVTFNEIYPNAL
jgi:Ca2+-binding EF-hand superfamily protein